MVVIWNNPVKLKKSILWVKHQIFFFFFFLFELLVSVINHYHINRLHLFWDSFEWFCLQINSDAKYFFLSCPRHCDQGLIVVIVYYFQSERKNALLLVEELSAVTWVPCILRHLISITVCFHGSHILPQNLHLWYIIKKQQKFHFCWCHLVVKA